FLFTFTTRIVVCMRSLHDALPIFSTGTHGTGARFGGLATQVRGLELVLADGSVVTCSADEQPELFAAARVGLGALGVITTVTLQDRKSTRLNSSHVKISYAVFCSK